MKKFLMRPAVQAGGGFMIGWVAGRGTATGSQGGEVIIGGIVVGLIVTVIYHVVLERFFK